MRNGIMRSIIALTILLTFVICTSAETPDGVKQRRAIGFVNLVKAGDPDELIAYMHKNWVPAEPGADRDSRWPKIAKSLTDRHAGLEILGVMMDKKRQLTIATRDKGGLTLSFIFDFESDSPYRVTRMGVEAGDREPGPDLLPFEIAPGSGREGIGSALQTWFDDLAAQGVFSGTALVSWRGEKVFAGAWGLANIEWNAPNQIDTRFDLGSINKSFTKIAVGQLMSQGKLSLDDTIANHLADYPNLDVAHRVTIRHLLEHSSGLGDIFTDDFRRSSKALYRSPEDFFPLFADEPLQFEPGERSEYSNAGFMVLGAIVAAVSGMPYDEYVKQHIFAPIGMTNSGFFAHDEPVPNVAVGYTRMGPDNESGELRNNLFMLPIKGNSAGSAQSTVEDLLRFDNAVREHKLLPPAYTEWYFYDDDSADTSSQASAERATAGIGIAGGAPGVSATVESGGDLAVIVLSNFDAPITESVARAIYRPLKEALEESD